MLFEFFGPFFYRVFRYKVCECVGGCVFQIGVKEKEINPSTQTTPDGGEGGGGVEGWRVNGRPKLRGQIGVAERGFGWVGGWVGSETKTRRYLLTKDEVVRDWLRRRWHHRRPSFASIYISARNGPDWTTANAPIVSLAMTWDDFKLKKNGNTFIINEIGKEAINIVIDFLKGTSTPLECPYEQN